MCGISGIVNFHSPVSLKNYYKSHLLIRHRGMDDEGFFVLKSGRKHLARGDDSLTDFGSLPHIKEFSHVNVVLGHRRLSIIDLSPNGHQPFQISNGRYTGVYNGEIYNYIELREELMGLGRVFHTQSDTEVLLAAYEQWGVAAFNKFNGMWAAAIYDAQDGSVVLTRDRFGVKPLFYSIQNQTLYFASELKFLLSELLETKIREQSVKDYLVANKIDYGGSTFYENIHQVKPGHFLKFSLQGGREERYWELPHQQIKISEQDALDALEQLLMNSIKLRLRSDVPVGSLLSGGLDSTVIVCLIASLLSKEKRLDQFQSFSAVFNEQEFSERRYIEETHEQTGIKVNWVTPDPDNLASDLDQIFYYQEQPFRSLAVYAQYCLYKKVAASGVKVILNGQGSDEIFGGYSNHHFAIIAQLLKMVRFFRLTKKVWRISMIVVGG